MSLIKCPECGRYVSDRANTCPNCGYPLAELNAQPVEPETWICPDCGNENYIDDMSCPNCGCPAQENVYPHMTNNHTGYYYPTPNDPYQNSQAVLHSDNETSTGFPVMGVIAVVLSILGFTSLIGFILAIIELKREDKKSKAFCWVSIGICAFWLFVFICNIASSSKHSSDSDKYSQQTESYTQSIEEESSDEYSFQEEKPVSDSVEYNDTDYEDVFFYDLTDNLDYYNGKNIRTVVKVKNCYADDVAPYIRSEYSDYELAENPVGIKIYPYNYQKFESGEYIIVEGTLAKDGSEDVLANAYISSSGTEAQTAFEDGLTAYIQHRNVVLQQNRETFISNCTDVSYEDLRRYPDTYKDVPIKLTIYIQDVEPDGWIFPGDIIATLNGEEIAVYDERQVREPRIMKGDTITVYATGYGLSKMQVKQKGAILNKTIDEYDVPAIKIIYTENDKSLQEEEPESQETDPQPTQEAVETPQLTTGQKNALATAKNYISFMPFSYTGLIEQLEFEKYSHEDAVYAADNCGADWNEQAALQAKTYLELSPFSRDDLIEQLEFEGFTHEQAVYGVEQNGY